MAAITNPLVAAGIVFFIGIAATWHFPHAEYDAGDIDAKMLFRFLLGPLCFAFLILLLGGEADRLFSIWWLQP